MATDDARTCGRFLCELQVRYENMKKILFREHDVRYFIPLK